MAAQAEQLLESRAGPRRNGGPSNTAGARAMRIRTIRISPRTVTRLPTNVVCPPCGGRSRSSYFCWIVAMCETSAPIRALTRASDGSSA
jgi:hypothetical protein